MTETTLKQTRIKMGLLRQKQVQHISTEKSPLLKSNEVSSLKNFEHVDEEDKTKTASAGVEKLFSTKSEAIQKNASGQKIITLKRGLLQHKFSSSTSINESSFSKEASFDSIEPSVSSNKDLAVGFVLAIFGAGLMSGLTGIFVRLANENEIGAAETLLIRSVFQATLFGVLICVKQQPFSPTKGKFWLTFIIAAVYSVASITSFNAFNVIPPGNAITTRGAVRSVFYVILAFLINREEVLMKDVLAIIFCTAGVSCIFSSSVMASGSADVDAGEFEANLTLQNIYGYVLIISAGITRSLGMVLVQKMKGELHSFVVVFYYSILIFLITFVLLFIYPLKWPPSGAGMGYAAAVCVTSSIAIWSSNRAVQLIHPALVSLGQNMDMIVSIILGHIALHLPASFLELFGATLILASVSGITWTRWKSKNNKGEYS